METEFNDWIERQGGLSAASRVFNISRQLCQYWRDVGVPPKHVPRIARITGIAPEKLRPDMYEVA